MSTEPTRVPSADPHAVEAVAKYRTAREHGEWRRLLLPGADLRNTDISDLNLDECDLTGAVLDGALFTRSSLIRASLAGASLVGADFSYANLDRADMEGVNATAAAFNEATLRKADLSGCRLSRAQFPGADLSWASLYESDLTSANLKGALAAQTDLRGTTLEDAVLTGVRGEPLFDSALDPSHAVVIGWPAARLGGPQLAELAGSYLNTRGWVTELSSSWLDKGVDLVAERDDIRAVIQVKATAAPSPETFAHLTRRLMRATEGYPEALRILVMPGPVPQRILDLAQASKVTVLWVLVEGTGMRVEEIVGINDDTDPLQVSA